MSSLIRLVGDGVRQLWPTPPYIDQAHITILVDGISEAYEWVSAQQIRTFDTPVEGQEVIIQRNTPGTPLVNFQQDRMLNETELDLAFRQSLYVAEEAFDLGRNSIRFSDTGGALDAQDFRITNVGSPSLDTDAVPLSWVRQSSETAMAAILAIPDELAQTEFVVVMLEPEEDPSASFDTVSGTITFNIPRGEQGVPGVFDTANIASESIAVAVTDTFINSANNEVARLTQDGLINLQNGNLRFYGDIDGDAGNDTGDVDYDIFAWSNRYDCFGNDYHMRFNISIGSPHVNEARLVWTADDRTVSCHPGRDYAGVERKNFAIGPPRSRNYFGVWNGVTGFLGLGLGVNQVDPAARLHARDAASTVVVVESTSPTARVAFQGSNQTNATRASLGIDSADRLVLEGGGAEFAKIGGGALQAAEAGQGTLGSATFPFATAFLVNSPTVTSDARKKEDFKPITEPVIAAWSEVEFGTFRYIEGPSRDIQLGVLAQRIIEVFEARGMNALDWGLVEDGDFYSVRYEQCLILEAQLQRNLTNAILQRLEALETKEAGEIVT